MRSGQRFQFIELIRRKGVSNLRQPFSEHPIQDCAAGEAYRVARVKILAEKPVEASVPRKAHACGHGFRRIISVDSARSIERMLA